MKKKIAKGIKVVEQQTTPVEKILTWEMAKKKLRKDFCYKFFFIIVNLWLLHRDLFD